MADVASAETLLNNGSFESDLDGWETDLSDAISVKNDSGWSAPGGGDNRLDYNIYASDSLEADTFQTITGLEAGKYILSAYVANSGSFIDSYMYAQTGKETFKVQIPSAGDWTLVELPVVIQEGEVIVGFYTDGEPGAWLGIDVV